MTSSLKKAPLMSAKISNLNELYPLVTSEEKISVGVLDMIGRFDLKRLLKPLSGFKSRGINLHTILSALILCRFRGLSVYSMYKSGQIQLGKNALYRMMNHSGMDWRRLLRGMAQQFLKIVSINGAPSHSTRCFVIDDTLIPKTGSTIEGVSKVHNHVNGGFLLGFKMLLLTLWDGKSLLPIESSLHRESKDNNWGLTPKQIKHQYRKEREEKTPASERFKELDIEKTTVALQMLCRACKHGILANYVLMDSWFVNDMMLKGIRGIRKGMMHVVGMCKMDARKFVVHGRELKSEAIIKLEGTKKGGTQTSKRFKSKYIKVDAIYKGTPVRLYYVKYKGANKWKLLLTTDLSLSFVKAMELYQIRWTIEVLFKECKQYLRLGQAQNTDFDGQIADITITLLTHLILSLGLRFQAYETMGGLFRDIQSQMIHDTLHERILKTILEVIVELLEFLSIDVEESIERLIAAGENGKKVVNLLVAVNQICTNNVVLKVSA
jgi:hypothetical protein